MVMILDDTKRTAIATELANMKEMQNFLISNEQKLLSKCDNKDIHERLEHMLEDDQKNMDILDTVIVQYGIQSKPKKIVKQNGEKVDQLIESAEVTLYEKMSQHELLKHQQVMSGLLVHKAAQVMGADVEAAITPLNTVNFENRAHQEELKGVLEVLGVMEMTGQEPEQGIWARVQDAIASFTGIADSATSSTNTPQKIQDMLRMDHKKIKMLFSQIESTNDLPKIQEYFTQLYKDLSVHSEAEEQVIYPAVRLFYGDIKTQKLYDEQAQTKLILNAMKAMSNHASTEFKSQIHNLKKIVIEHFNEEENTLFSAINHNCSDQQMEQLATQFKTAKSTLQKQLIEVRH